MSEAEQLFHELATTLPNATESRMFGAMCIKAPNGKAAAMFWKGDMVFKTDKTTEPDLLSLDGAHVFSPAEGKKMGGWIVVPFHYKYHWKTFTQSSLQLATSAK